ncbi:MAG TPA: bifunctional riboflavin kinase/FAD synthetase [Egibacteraceae bacterium]|nr:bifunctional riboflavin kinase/FAD synthetase [Egibacteraceae bacterium]
MAESRATAAPQAGGDPQRVVTDLAAVPREPSAVSIGFFDGVHRGHQAIIAGAARRARERGLRSAVVTFDRHPMEVVAPGSQPKLLMTLERRVRTIAEQDVDVVVVLRFDDELRHRSPEEFVDGVLVGPLGARSVIVGANFRFGHRAAGDLERLSQLGQTRGFDVDGVSLLELDGVVISSSAIRARVDVGDVAAAARMLGRAHLVDGVVVRGDRRGVSLGYPTANLQVSRRAAVPARGVYAGMFHRPDGSRHPCATSVGVNPTFGGQELRVEAHLIDFAGDLYGERVAVDFRHRLRGELRFDGADALVARMHEDVTTARRLLGLA